MNGLACCSQEKIKDTKSLPLTMRFRQYRSSSFFLLKVKIFSSSSRVDVLHMDALFYSSNPSGRLAVLLVADGEIGCELSRKMASRSCCVTRWWRPVWI